MTSSSYKLSICAQLNCETINTFSFRLSICVCDPIIRTPGGVASRLTFNLVYESPPTNDFSMSFKNTINGPFWLSSLTTCGKWNWLEKWIWKNRKLCNYVVKGSTIRDNGHLKKLTYCESLIFFTSRRI